MKAIIPVLKDMLAVDKSVITKQGSAAREIMANPSNMPLVL